MQALNEENTRIERTPPPATSGTADAANILLQIGNLPAEIDSEVGFATPAGTSRSPAISHLDGKQSFGQMLDNGIGGVSKFARRQPALFLAVAQKLREECPDAFNIIPPETVTNHINRQAMVFGRCQSGKSKLTLVLAWLYWHYCGCFTFLGTWRFRSSNEVREMTLKEGLC